MVADNPILNSPYEEPRRHCATDDSDGGSLLKSVWCLLIVLLLLLAPSAARAAEILPCLGPDNAVLFTNAACPEGFTLLGRLPAHVPAGSLPCTEADSLGPASIDAALLDATSRLQAARASAKDGESVAAWERCLSRLAARKAALQSAEARPDVETAKPPPEKRVAEVCTAGSFETRSQPGGFDVLYTNRSPHACRSVRYYCLWGVFSSAGFYQQSESAVYQGRIGPGETLAIATIEPRSGPVDREVVWSWCEGR